ncbi:hypothetical protein O3P69_010386 [Scylla paramamosain]|uniref:Uncharacterized protein n=1 Tax=Scylla paramamosain TaxID=85552 RepID=A0AAW0TSA1_SCYPA
MSPRRPRRCAAETLGLLKPCATYSEVLTRSQPDAAVCAARAAPSEAGRGRPEWSPSQRTCRPHQGKCKHGSPHPRAALRKDNAASRGEPSPPPPPPPPPGRELRDTTTTTTTFLPVLSSVISFKATLLPILSPCHHPAQLGGVRGAVGRGILLAPAWHLLVRRDTLDSKTLIQGCRVCVIACRGWGEVRGAGREVGRVAPQPVVVWPNHYMYEEGKPLHGAPHHHDLHSPPPPPPTEGQADVRKPNTCVLSFPFPPPLPPPLSGGLPVPASTRVSSTLIPEALRPHVAVPLLG